MNSPLCFSFFESFSLWPPGKTLQSKTPDCSLGMDPCMCVYVCVYVITAGFFHLHWRWQVSLHDPQSAFACVSSPPHVHHPVTHSHTSGRLPRYVCDCECVWVGLGVLLILAHPSLVNLALPKASRPALTLTSIKLLSMALFVSLVFTQFPQAVPQAQYMILFLVVRMLVSPEQRTGFLYYSNRSVRL